MSGPEVTPLPKAKRRKKGPKTKVRDECDRLFSLLIRQRDGSCVVCFSTENLQCAHGFSRSYVAVRWDERNAWALCRAHHVRYTHRPLEWDDFLKERWGSGLYREIRTLALTHGRPDMDVLLADLKARVA